MKIKMLPKIKVGNLGTWGIKNKPQNSVYILIGVLWGILLQNVAWFFTPFLWLPLWVLGGLTTSNVKGENEQKKGNKVNKVIFKVCVRIDKVVKWACPILGFANSERRF